ncbi:hypothetical protein HanPSC8_Chr09g0367071 [Helianthus annuus]|nr:hypothetical protein HanPSC8_Chr09g0367071 [Helianthus annuus]
MVQSFWILLFYFGLDSLVLYSVRCHLDCSNVIVSLFKRFGLVMLLDLVLRLCF